MLPPESSPTTSAAVHESNISVLKFATPAHPTHWLICAQAKTDNLAKDPAAAARGLAAFSVGLDPKNPYVTQQTNTQFLWYELDVESNLYR